ncbi:MAG: filamentous hemagglutinin N-terminal domain-containing protein [Leptolyngbyaceae cyanobacterium]
MTKPHPIGKLEFFRKQKPGIWMWPDIWHNVQLVAPGLACVFVAGQGVLLLAGSAQGQIIPDNTLGTESSVVNSGDLVDLIEGGAVRGSGLFHSFEDFNVNAGQQVYFANPVGIENILSRVTGLNPSEIDGLLGVDGAANLFFLNPNGIVFGPNAQLDVDGAFLASTSDRFQFADGTEFRATNPNGAPLVTVNIRPGLQLGPNSPAPLFSNSDLVAGEDLTLSAGSVTSTGNLVAPNGEVRVESTAGDVRVQGVEAESAVLSASQDLVLEESRIVTEGNQSLLAERSIRVRDSEATPFFSSAGGDLLVQGNAEVDILALNHLEVTPFQSGDDLRLVSDGIVSGDAHFDSGGSFEILDTAGNPGEFVSLYDPIISAEENVRFGTYTGTSLLVEAEGSIRTDGDITITAPDATFAGEDPETDRGILGSSAALILRAGLNDLQQSENNDNVSVSDDMTVDPQIPFTLPEDPDLLESPTFLGNGGNGDTIQLGGNITAGTASDVGRVILSAPGGIILDQDVAIASAGGNVTVDIESPINSANNETNDLIVTAGNGDVTFAAAVGEGNNRELGTLQVNSGGTTRFNSTVEAASLTTNAGGGTVLRGNVTTENAQTYNDTINLEADITLNGNGIDFNNAVRSTGGDSGRNLTVDAGTGDVTFNAAVGNGNNGELGDLDVISSGTTTFASTVEAASLIVNTGNEAIFQDDITASDNIDITAGDARLESASSLNTTDGEVEVNAANSIQLNGDAAITTDGGDVTLRADSASPTSVQLQGSASITAPRGIVRLVADNVALIDQTEITTAGGGGEVLIGVDSRNGPVLATQVAITPAVDINAGAATGRVRIGAIGPSPVSPAAEIIAPEDNITRDYTSGVEIGTVNNDICDACLSFTWENILISSDDPGNGAFGDPILDQIFDPSSFFMFTFPEQLVIHEAVITGEQASVLGDLFANSQGFVLTADDTLTFGDNVDDRLTLPASEGAASFAAGMTILANDPTDVLISNGRTLSFETMLGDLTVPSLDISSATNLSASILLNAATGNVDLTNVRLNGNRSTNDTAANVISIQAPNGEILVSDSTITANNAGTGFAGRLNFNADEVSIRDNSLLSADGQFGQVQINGVTEADIQNSTLRARLTSDDSVQAGNLEIASDNQVTIRDSFILSSAGGNALGGAITITGAIGDEQDYTNAALINLGDIRIEDSILTSTTSGSGSAGRILFRDANQVELIDTRVLTSVTGSATGLGGDINVNNDVRTLTLTDSRLEASTTSTDANANGGSVSVDLVDQLSLDNSTISVATEGAATGGEIRVSANTANLANNSALDATVGSTGSGIPNADSQEPAIRIATTVTGTTLENPALSLNNSQISTSVATGASGNAGSIEVESETIRLNNGARIQSQTGGTGNAGNIAIDFDEAFQASGSNNFGRSSGVLTSSESAEGGVGGDITLNDDSPRGTLTLTDRAFLAASTRSDNPGGDIDVNVATLSLNSGGQIVSAALQAGGNAGDIAVTATERVTVTGSNTPITFESPFGATADAAIPVIELNDTANQVVSEPGAEGFAYFSFNVASGNSTGEFDIDGGYEPIGFSFSDVAPTSIDTEIFLFDGRTGELLAANDDSAADSGSNPLPFSSLSYDSSLEYTFLSAGNYVIGVGEFPSSAPLGAPITGAAPESSQTYTLNVALSNPGTGGTINPSDINPNLELTEGVISSGFLASSEEDSTGTAGTIAIQTPRLDVQDQGIVSASTSGAGGGGSLNINANTINLDGIDTDDDGIDEDNVTGLFARTEGQGQAGTLTLSPNTGNDLVVNLSGNAQASATTTGSGNGGNLSIQADDLINISGEGQISAETEGAGRAGSVTLSTQTLTIEDRASVSATATETATTSGAGGNVFVNANTINLLGTDTDGDAIDEDDETGLFAGTGGQASAGNLTLTPLDSNNLAINLSGNAQASAATTGSGNGGNLSIQADNSIRISGEGQIAAETEDAGRAGGVALSTQTFTIEDGASVSATATETATTSETGNGISVTANTINLSGTDTDGDAFDEDDKTGLFARTEGQAPASNLTLTPLDSSNLAINLSGNAQASAATTGSGNGGNLSIRADNAINISGEGQISAETVGSGTAGRITVNTPTVTVEDRASVSTSTLGTGAGGNLNINADTINLDGIDTDGDGIDEDNVTGLFARTEGQGQAGTLTLRPNTRNDLVVNLSGNAQASATTTGSGNGGNLSIEAEDSIDISGEGQISAETEGAGRAGSVTLSTQILTIEDRASVSATATETATTTQAGGGISVNANTINLLGTDTDGDDIDEDDETGLFARTEGQAPASNLTLNPNIGSNLVINLAGNSQASTTTSGSGIGGNLVIQADDSIDIAGRGEISAETTSNGRAGNIAITTQTLNIRAEAGLSATAEANGEGGSVTIQATEFSLDNASVRAEAIALGGQAGSIDIQTQDLRAENSAIQATNVDSMIGGNVTVGGLNVSESSTANSVYLSGTFNGEFGGISASSANGTAGSVTVRAENLDVFDGAAINVSSGSLAGIIDIDSDFVVLENGRLTAQTGSANAGENSALISLEPINEEAPDNILWLRNESGDNESLISATSTGNADGGNIQIDTDFIIAEFPTGSEGSDIFANAGDGNGGNIEINALGIFGIRVRPERTPLNDITASSESGVQGTITVNTLEADPDSGLAELAFEFIDASDQATNQCVVDSGEASSVRVAGRGGLPTMPTDVLGAIAAGDDDWVTLEPAPETAPDEAMQSTLTEDVAFAAGVESDRPQAVCHRVYRASQEPI